MIKKLIIAFACSIALTLHGMETEQPEENVWNLLLPEIKTKIFACADLETKEKVYFKCWHMFPAINMCDLIKHSPVVLPRKYLFHHMINAAKENNSALFADLMSKAQYCDDANVLQTAAYFFPENSEEQMLLQEYKNNKSDEVFEQLLPHIMEVFVGEPETWEQYCELHDTTGRGLSPLLLLMMAEHISSVCELALLHYPEWLLEEHLDMEGPLFYSVNCGRSDITKLFVRYGADVNSEELGNSLLMSAVRAGSFDIVKFLIGKGADINYRETTGHEFTIWGCALSNREWYMQNLEQSLKLPVTEGNFFTQEGIVERDKIIEFLSVQPNLIKDTSSKPVKKRNGWCGLK